MVGRRGVEPRDTCLSDRPVDRLGRGQQMVEDPTPRQSWLSHPASNGRLPPGRFTIQVQRAEVLILTVSRRPPAFETGPATRQVHSPWRKTENSNLRAFRPPPAFQTGTTTRWFHLPWRRAEKSNPTVSPAHSLAARPGTLAGSLSMITSYRSADSNREPPGSGPGAST